jgi:HPt (histidine-containing phosphotransfer) domain-containing protein
VDESAATLVKDILEQLRALEAKGSPGLARQVLDVFLLDTSNRLNALREGIDRRDFNAIYQAAHSMQGSASMVGARALSERCRELAGAARAESFEPCQALADELYTAFEAIRQASIPNAPTQ